MQPPSAEKPLQAELSTQSSVQERNYKMESLLYFLLIGLAAGWLAGRIARGAGFGLVGNLIVGVIGALLGGWIFGLLGIGGYGLIGSLAAALVGALLLLFLLRFIKS